MTNVDVYDKTRFVWVPSTEEDPLLDDDLIRKSWVITYVADELAAFVVPAHAASHDLGGADVTKKYFTWLLCTPSAPVAGTTTYISFCGNNFYEAATSNISYPTYNTDETKSKNIIPAGITVVAMYVYVTTAPGSGKTLTVTLRRNTGDTAVAVTLNNANSGSWSGSVTLSAGDIVNFKTLLSTGGTAPGAHSVMVVYYITNYIT